MEQSEQIVVPEPYDAIGVLLRKTREEVRIPIDQAARMLHIRVRYLDALEQGRLDELPGITYTKGYLQSYAAFLGLDKDEIIRRFEATEGLLGKKGFFFPQVFSKQKSPSHWLVWGGLGMAVAIYMVWLLFLQPPDVRISVVERVPAPPPQVERIQVSADMMKDVACLSPQDVLYPACTQPREFVYSVTPLHKELNSIMDLAVLDPEDDY